MSFIDHYKILGVPPNATTAQIEATFRAKMHQCHPDKNNGSPESEEIAKRLNQARTVLRDSSKRAKHDKEMLRHWLKTHSRATSRTKRPNHSLGFSGGTGLILAAGLALLWLSGNTNSYDSNVERYRDKKGRFRKGRFF